MKAYDRVAAYRAVMARIRDTVELAPNRAPQTWLAEQLGVNRQLVYWWEDRGFPEKHAQTIADMLRMDPMEVCPQIPMYLPQDVFATVLAGTTTKKTFLARLIEMLRAAAGEIKEPFPVKRKSAPLTKEQPMKPIGGFIPISAEELANQREEALKAGADLSVKGRAK